MIYLGHSILNDKQVCVHESLCVFVQIVSIPSPSSLFKHVVPMMRSESMDITESLVLGLGRTNPIAFRCVLGSPDLDLFTRCKWHIGLTLGID